ncbi:MAG: TolC family protein [Paludibacter sp.]|nr:TolC family protein [Paludibacter sp.]
MKTKIYMIVGALLVTLLVNAQKPWTLQQCVDTALANNRNIKQQALTKKTKDILYDQARKNLLPNLNASASQNFYFGRSTTLNNTYQNTNSSQSSIGIGSSLTLFDGLKMKYNIDASKADMYASDADLEKIKSDITTSVAAGFLQILLNKELLQIAIDQLELTKTKIEQRKGLVAAGKMAEGEMYDLLAEEAKEEQSKIQAQNTLNLSFLDLAQILELDNFQNLDIVAPENLSESDLLLLSADEVYNSAITHRPEIRGAEYRLKSNENNILINKADFYPKLTFGAQFGTGYSYFNNYANKSFNDQLSGNMSTQLGFSLNIPIFNKFDVHNRVKMAEISVLSSKLSVENAKLELKKTIQQAYYNALGAKSRWDAALKSETASREAYRFTNQKFEAGRATLYELYQAKSNLTQVLSEQAQAKYEYFFRIKLLELLK